MKIVVFGATGIIGTPIAAELKQRGHQPERSLSPGNPPN